MRAEAARGVAGTLLSSELLQGSLPASGCGLSTGDGEPESKSAGGSRPSPSPNCEAGSPPLASIRLSSVRREAMPVFSLSSVVSVVSETSSKPPRTSMSDGIEPGECGAESGAACGGSRELSTAAVSALGERSSEPERAMNSASMSRPRSRCASSAARYL
jgi:hypothetical protein